MVKFLETSALPREYDPTGAGPVPVDVGLPRQHAHLITPTTLAGLAGLPDHVRGALAVAVDQPLELWLRVLEVAKVGG